jgi:glucose/arabinose dehydrogenase
MRLLFIIIFILSLASAAFTQTNQRQSNQQQPAQQQANQNDNQSGSSAEKIPDGYGDLTWEMYISDARDKISGVLTYSDEKTVIRSKDNEMEYYYGFFYKEPTEEKIQADANAGNTPAENTNTQEKDEGKLFYVSMNFPYLGKDQVYDKIQNKYGKHKSENIKDNKGAIAWSSDNTIIIMWVDQYERKPFCRRIIYISKKMSSELNAYVHGILNKTEIDLIKRMNP